MSKKVMIFFDNSVDSFNNPIESCTSVDECLDICGSHPEACSAPTDVEKLQRDGVWSRERQNNPFADYFKVISLKNVSKRQIILSNEYGKTYLPTKSSLNLAPLSFEETKSKRKDNFS